MVEGVPRMCIRIQVEPREAMVLSIEESRSPADTSLIISAPALIAARATEE